VRDTSAASGTRVWAVVLAAGASSRFGSPKQRLLLEPVLQRVRRSSVDEVLVVLGAHDVETSARCVCCAEWERGPGASLRCGLEALPPATEAAVVVLGDGPELAPKAIDRVIDVWRAGDAEVVAATYGGIRLHPVLIARSAWEDIPDEGAKTLGAVLVPCDDLNPPGDIDLAQQLPESLKAPPTTEA
jgi:CTP:molybdopterin cytidylyltransferase MocA